MPNVAGHGWPGKPKSAVPRDEVWIKLLNYKRLPGGPTKAQLPRRWRAGAPVGAQDRDPKAGGKRRFTRGSDGDLGGRRYAH